MATKKSTKPAAKPAAKAKDLKPKKNAKGGAVMHDIRGVVVHD